MERAAIGIDLGTTFSVGSIYMNEKLLKFRDFTDKSATCTIPSMILFSSNGLVEVGTAAKNTSIGNRKKSPTGKEPRHLYDAKRMIGRSWEDEKFQSFIKDWDFTVEQGPLKPIASEGHEIRIKVPFDHNIHEYLAPYEISAMVLAHIKSIGEELLGCPITAAVITVPAYFGDAERRDTKLAAEIAGLKVLRIVNEPTAAAIAYGADIGREEKKTILIFDLGGGTFDVTILDIKHQNGQTYCDVIATDGDAALGGRDIERNMLNFLVDKCKEKIGVDLKEKPKWLSRLKAQLEQTKISLSSNKVVEIVEEFSDDVTFVHNFTQDEFNNINEDIYAKCLNVLKRIFDSAKTRVSKEKISEVILVGGSTYIPKIKEIVEKFTGKTSHSRIQPELVVAHGAALLAASLSGMSNMTLIDVVSNNIGVEVKGREMSPIVHKDDHLPAIKSDTYRPMTKNQNSIRVKVLEGKKLLSSENKTLKEEVLSGFPNNTNIDITFLITVSVSLDGIVDVTVECQQSDWKRILHCESLSCIPSLSSEKISEFCAGIRQLLQGEPLSAYTNKVRPISDSIKKLDTILERAKTVEGLNNSELEKIEKWIKDNRLSCDLSDVQRKTEEVLYIAKEFAVVLQNL